MNGKGPLTLVPDHGGDQDAWTFICRVNIDGFEETTRAMQISDKGCLVQVTAKRYNQQRNEYGSWVIAKSLTFAPGVKVVKVFGSDTFTLE